MLHNVFVHVFLEFENFTVNESSGPLCGNIITLPTHIKVVNKIFEWI